MCKNAHIYLGVALQMGCFSQMGGRVGSTLVDCIAELKDP